LEKGITMTSIKTKRIKILLSVLILFAVIFVLGGVCFKRWMYSSGKFMYVANDIDAIITYYIRHNNGQFPESEDELIKQNLIQKRDTNKSEPEYYLNGEPGNPEREMFVERPLFKHMTIAYGTELEDLYNKDGKLYNKFTNQQALLIKGPTEDFVINNFYKSLSSKWHGLMIEYREQNQTN
jgi:hypothetical protein